MKSVTDTFFVSYEYCLIDIKMVVFAIFSQVDAVETQYEMTGLKRFTEYEVSIKTYNSYGVYSAPSDRILFTTSG